MRNRLIPAGIKAGGSVVLATLLLLLLTACFNGRETLRANSGSEEAPMTGEAGLSLVPLWSGLERPVGLATAPGKADKLYVIEQEGRVLALDREDPGKQPVTVLDLTDRVHSEASEQGLLGLAFDPDYADNGYAYVNYTTEQGTVIARFTFLGGRGDTGSEQKLLSYDQPYANHNGGQLAFGPDGYLYIASGDGGSRGDPHDHAQDRDSLLGKIIRLDPDDAEPRAEIYAYGLRNPWRFSFDAETGELWAADVGQNELEEINLIVQGGNYGWRRKEGNACYEPLKSCDPGGLIDPIWVYPHSEGQSITGGYVYRGSIEAIRGWYVYGDFVSGKIWALRRLSNGQVENRLLLDTELPIASFGVDQDRELYAVAYDGAIYQFRSQ